MADFATTKRNFWRDLWNVAMANGNGTTWLKLLTTASLTANLALASAWFIWGRSAATREDVRSIFKAEIDYPYLQDRGLVMAHLESASVHENDAQKRQRIRQELDTLQKTIQAELIILRADVEFIKEQLRK